MSLFQCDVCGCIENTACVAAQGFKNYPWIDDFDWSYAPDRKGKRLCSVCGPTHWASGKPLDRNGRKGGEWHGMFTRRFLPLGMFRTARNGNLEHIETLDQDYRPYLLEEPQVKENGS